MDLPKLIKPPSISRMKPCRSLNPTPWWTLPSHPLPTSPGSRRLGSGKTVQKHGPSPIQWLPFLLPSPPDPTPPLLAGTDWRPLPLTILLDPTRTTQSSLLARKLAWYLKFWQRPVLSLWMTACYWKRSKRTTMQSRYILGEHSLVLPVCVSSSHFLSAL